MTGSGTRSEIQEAKQDAKEEIAHTMTYAQTPGPHEARHKLVKQLRPSHHASGAWIDETR